MQSLTQPTLLLKPFADEGDRNNIPDENTDTSNPQLADLTNGFPQITSRAPSAGGLPAERKDFNALGYLTTLYDFYYQAGGTFTYNATIASAIGGYPLGARLWYTDSAGVACILRSTIGNNTNNFLTDPTVIGEVGSGKPWVIDRFRGYNTIYTLFDTKWTDYELTSQDWLRADTFSWNSGAVYTDAYNHLVNDISGITSQTETVGSYTITYYLASDGHKIVMPNQETAVQNIYNESGVAWYYILDTTNTRFKLPRINPLREELLQTIGVRGNGKALGLDGKTSNNEIVNLGIIGRNDYGIVGRVDAYNSDIGTTTSGTQPTSINNRSLGVTSDTSKSGVVSDLSSKTSVYSGNKCLYFYVGQFSQSATEQTAGLNTNLFTGKVDLDFNNMSPSNTAKQTIIGWMMPDYSNGSSVTSNDTMVKNGFLTVRASDNNRTSWVKINNVEVFTSSWGASYGSPDNACYPVSVGDVVTYAGVSIKFYPCKGG